MPVTHFADFQWVLAVGRCSDETAVGMLFAHASFLVPGSQNSLENIGNLSVFAKRLLRGAPVLAYKFQRFCLDPYRLERKLDSIFDNGGEMAQQIAKALHRYRNARQKTKFQK